MKVEMGRVEDAVLALLSVFAFDERVSWKTCDYDITMSLFQKV